MASDEENNIELQSNAACDSITGECICEMGYKGPDCKERGMVGTMGGVR